MIGLLPFFSGAAALSHELLWTRRLIDLLGATDWVTGRVLGLFFLGLSLGGYLATLKVFRRYPAIYRLAIAELLVALLALPALSLGDKSPQRKVILTGATGFVGSLLLRDLLIYALWV